MDNNGDTEARNSASLSLAEPSMEAFYETYSHLGLYHSPSRFIHLELDIVNRCNLRCIMCFHSLAATQKAPTVYLHPDDFSLVAQRVLPYAYRLSLSLGNEPLMSPFFIPILKIAAAYNVEHVNFFTNGLLLDNEKINAIVENGVTQVCISVDGATPDTYNAIRRGGDFHRLVKNVQKLIKARDTQGSTFPRIRFDMVLMRRNIHEIVRLVELASDLGVQDLNFAHLVAFEGLDMEKESLVHDKQRSNHWLARGLKKAGELDLDVQFHPALFDLSDLPAAESGKMDRSPKKREPTPQIAVAAEKSPAMPYLPTPYCPYPFFHVTMGPGGHLLPCPFSHGEAPYGILSAQNPFERVWLGPQFTTLRHRILDHDPPGMCRRCSFLSNRYPDVAAFFVTRDNRAPDK